MKCPKTYPSGAQSCTPLIPVLRRLRQVDLCVFKGSLAYIIRPLSGGGDKNKTNYSYLCSRLTPLLPSSQYRQGHPSLLNSFSWLLLFLQFAFILFQIWPSLDHCSRPQWVSPHLPFSPCSQHGAFSVGHSTNATCSALCGNFQVVPLLCK